MDKIMKRHVIDIEDTKRKVNLRDEVIGRFLRKEINFEQLCTIAELPEYITLGRTKVRKILKKMSGWTEPSVAMTFNAYGVNLDTTVNHCIRHERLRNIVSTIADSSPTTWQRRPKAPEGFPWNGNILRTLERIDGIELPAEIDAATRFFPTKNKTEYVKEAYREYEDIRDENGVLREDQKHTDSLEGDGLDVLLEDESSLESTDTEPAYDSDSDDIFGDIFSVDSPLNSVDNTKDDENPEEEYEEDLDDEDEDDEDFSFLL